MSSRKSAREPAAPRKRFAVIPIEAFGVMSPADFKVYAALALHASKDGACRPSYGTLATLTGCSVATVKRALKRLRERGFVEWERGAYARSTNTYRLPRHPLSNEVTAMTRLKHSKEVTAMTRLDAQRGHSYDLLGDSKEVKSASNEVTAMTHQRGHSYDPLTDLRTDHLEHIPKESTLRESQEQARRDALTALRRELYEGVSDRCERLRKIPSETVESPLGFEKVLIEEFDLPDFGAIGLCREFCRGRPLEVVE